MKFRTILWLLMASILTLLGCKGADGVRGSGNTEQVSLNGAGATFPYPLYSKWMTEYRRQHPGIMLNYQSIGSGGGIRQVIARTVDFGATDTPMTKEESAKAPGKLVHIPMTLGAVAITYNIPGLAKPLRLTPEVLVDIYLGSVRKWNDPRIAALNEGAALPDAAISTVYRTDGSGTTAVFTEYLASVNDTWQTKVGSGKSVKWPTGLGAKGNEGIAGQVKTTPGAIGYVELAYAIQSQLPAAELKNAAGQFVAPSIPAITAAAASVEMPDTLYASATNSAGQGAYPISAFTYLLVYENADNPAKGKALAQFIWWAVHEGQKMAEPLHYAPLPAAVVSRVEKRLRELTANGQPLLTEV